MVSQHPDDEVLRVLALMLDAGEVMLHSGMAVSDCTDMLQRLAVALGHPRCEVIIELNTITLSYLPPELRGAVTLIRVVDIETTHLHRVVELEHTVRRVESGELDLAGAWDELERLSRLDGPYPWWLREAAGLVTVGGWVVFAGGAFYGVIVAMVAVVLARPLVLATRSLGVPDLFVTVVAAAVAVAVPYAAVAAGADFAVNPAIIAGLYPLLPGGALVASVSDGLAGNLQSSLARGLQAMIIAVGVAVGVLAALAVVAALDIELPETPPARWSIAVTAAAAALAVGALGLSRDVPVSALLPIAVLGAVASAVAVAVVPETWGREVAAGIGAVVLGVGARLVARQQHSVSTVYTSSAVLVLVPGTTLYFAMVSFVRGASEAGIDLTILALSISLSIAAGVALGEGIARSGPRLGLRATHSFVHRR